MDICTALQQGCSGHPCFADANMNQATSMGSKNMEMKMGVHQLDIPELSVYYTHTLQQQQLYSPLNWSKKVGNHLPHINK